MFNHRRQSQDRVLRAHIAALVGDARLWMNHYSAQQFDAESIQHLNVDDAFLQEAVDGDYCFVEDAALAPFERWIEKIIIFRWPEQRGADRHPCDTQRQLRRILCAGYLCADGHETAEVNGAVAEHRNVNIKRWILPVDHAARRDHRHVVKETSHQTGIGRPAVQPSFRHQQNDGHGKVGDRGEFDREDNLSCYTGTFSTFMPDADAPVYVLADGAC